MASVQPEVLSIAQQVFIFDVPVAAKAVVDMPIILEKVPRATKLFYINSYAIPLSEEETSLLKRLSGNNDVVKISYGIKEDGKVAIIRGCLKGMEPQIRKIDRHKRKAILDIELFGEMRTVEVGLEVKPPESISSESA